MCCCSFYDVVVVMWQFGGRMNALVMREERWNSVNVYQNNDDGNNK